MLNGYLVILYRKIKFDELEQKKKSEQMLIT